MKRNLVIAVLLLLVLVSACLSLLIGPSEVSVADAIRALISGDGDVFVVIMREIRLPRVLLSLMIGFALGLAGAVMQGFMRNPLAEPGVVGISASAALGAVMALQLGFAKEGVELAEIRATAILAPIFALPFFAIMAAIISACILLIFARSGKIEKLILVGIGISAIAGALTSLVLNLSPNPFAAMEIMFWMMGSVADRSMVHVVIVLPFIILGCLMIFSISRSLDTLSLGEDTAQSLGTNLARTGVVLIIAITMMVGASVAVTGAIGFVGLIVPHIMRLVLGPRPSQLLLPSGLAGAALLTVADILTRVIAPERDLKLGVLTALLGAPIFLHIVLKGRRE